MLKRLFKKYNLETHAVAYTLKSIIWIPNSRSGTDHVTFDRQRVYQVKMSKVKVTRSRNVLAAKVPYNSVTDNSISMKLGGNIRRN